MICFFVMQGCIQPNSFFFRCNTYRQEFVDYLQNQHRDHKCVSRSQQCSENLYSELMYITFDQTADPVDIF